MQTKQWIRLSCFVLSLLGYTLYGTFFASRAYAKDVRLAVLVGNEQGWKSDPQLNYVMSGDILPLARVLRSVGFTVKVLKNNSAEELREVLQWVQKRAVQKPKISTFLFYYTGHADRKVLHTGPQKKGAVSYKEFIRFIRSLPVQRRIAFFDACYSGEVIRQFGSLDRYKDLVRKGASGYQPIDISKTIPHQGEQKGLQIITSSADYAWESKRYKASVFTHHLLKGIRGRADRDRDGRISVDELFNYVSDAMVQDIRQKPQMFGVIHRSKTYALAPAYHSRLEIDSHVVGTLKVSVENFVWKRKKKTHRPLQLSVVHGWGTVHLKKGKTCWKQRIYLPKGGRAKLHRQWHPVACKKVAYTRKGSLELPSRLYIEPPRPWRMELSTGIWGGGPMLTPQSPLLGGELGIRWNMLGLFLETWGGQAQWGQQIAPRLYTGLRLEAGYSVHIGSWEFFVGAYGGMGLLWQNLQQTEQMGMLFRYGLSVAPALWVHRNWGLALRGNVGFTVAQLGGRIVHQLDGSLRLSLLHRF